MTIAAAQPQDRPPFVRRELTLFTVAVGFLTRLPVPRLSGYQPAWLARSARYFPLVGVIVGVINAGAWWLANQWLPNTVSVGLMLAASLLVTGAFHEDGFADACDGFGGGGSAAQVLAIMKDSRIGAYGAIGIFMLLGLKWSTLAATPPAALPLLVVTAHMMSRWCACGLLWRLRYVRDGEEGKARPFAEGLLAGEWFAGGAVGAVGAAGALAIPGVIDEPAPKVSE